MTDQELRRLLLDRQRLRGSPEARFLRGELTDAEAVHALKAKWAKTIQDDALKSFQGYAGFDPYEGASWNELFPRGHT